MHTTFRTDTIPGCRGYIDPGTGHAVYGALAPLLAGMLGLLLVIAALFRHWLRWGLLKIWHHKWISLLVLAVCAAIITVCVITFNKSTDMPYKKILVVGIDGLDPDICRELLKKGTMPNLAALMEQCTLHDLQVYNPAESPVSWSCLGCGVNPGKHGIFDFIHRDPETYLPRLSISYPASKMSRSFKHDRTGTPFWKYTTDAGIPTTVIRWPVTTPPENVSGRFLSGLGVTDICGHLNSYRFFTTRPGFWNASKNLQGITVSNKQFSGILPGPYSALGKEITIPFSGSVSDDGRHVTFQFQDTNIVLQAGDFSPWLTVRYKVGLVKKITAICQVFLCSIPGRTNAPLEFYVSSPEIDPRSPARVLTAPGSYAKDLAEAVGLYHTLGIPEDFNAAKTGHLPLDAFYEQCRAIEAERRKMFSYELERFTSGVLAVVFDTSDRWQHLGWKPGEPGRNAASFSPKVIEYYEQHADPLLGEIRNALDDDTALIVFSDHGFSSYTRSFNMNNWLAEYGYLTAASDANQENSALFKRVVWERTKAYSAGFTSIYLNQRGREGKGIVDPADAPRLKQEIAQRLKQYIDPETGIAPVEEVYDGTQIYYGDRADEAPDLVIGFKPGYRMGWQTAIGALGENICEDNTDKWQGDHLIDAKFVPGTLLVNIPVIDTTPRTIDLAPTILDCAGLEVPGGMDGISLRQPVEK